MVDTKETVRRQGLHGWRAAAAVFGCGTLAAFAVFGVVAGALNLLLDTATSGITSGDNDIPGVAQSAQPRADLEPGALDLCSDYLPQISDITITAELRAEHSDEAQDPGFDSEAARTVVGRCTFELTPQYGTTTEWIFNFDYEAVIRDPGQGRDQAASGVLQRRLVDAENEFASIESRGDHDWADASRSFYGESASGVAQYMVVSQTRSAVYTIAFLGDPDSVGAGEVSEFDFERQAEVLAGRLHDRFFRLIPE
ncbi:hypothetical protein [Nocardiopsis sp. CNR-923]|uniref:hypothetical protein n=1 Tax=Nocardiopsis sp. CNR-923 TaxID=1904965 RepID=UPI00117E6D8E|nr:hypothetical protein [Nocardiopsis sp. CNR-923]